MPKRRERAGGNIAMRIRETYISLLVQCRINLDLVRRLIHKS
jgi:hypothetical protein